MIKVLSEAALSFKKDIQVVIFNNEFISQSSSLILFHSLYIPFLYILNNNSRMIKEKTLQSFDYFYNKFYGQLTHNCLPQDIIPIFGRWEEKTFQSSIGSLIKNNLLQNCFPCPEAINITSNPKFQVQVFKLFDTKNLKRIDAYEVYCSMLICSCLEDQAFYKAVIQIFGMTEEGMINTKEFSFFLDSMFRSITKVIRQNKEKTMATQPNLRLDFQDIARICQKVFKQKKEYNMTQFIQGLKKQEKLYQFLLYIRGACKRSCDEAMLQNKEIMLTEKKKNFALQTK